MKAEQLAQLFHERYETLAPQFAYETRKASAVPWADVPENNKNLMVAVARDVLIELENQEEIRYWATSTELAGTNQERKSYFLILKDGDRPDLRFILHRHVDGHIVAEPYVDHEYDYTEYDSDDDDDYYDEDYDPDATGGDEPE